MVTVMVMVGDGDGDDDDDYDDDNDDDDDDDNLGKIISYKINFISCPSDVIWWYSHLGCPDGWPIAFFIFIGFVSHTSDNILFFLSNQCVAWP